MKIDSAIFYVKDLNQSVDFFTKKLDFKLEFKDGNRYASFIFEDNSKLGIIQTNEKEIDNPGHNAVKIGTNDAELLYEKYQDNDLQFYKEFTEESWAKEFIVFDPDKNKLIFAERR